MGVAHFDVQTRADEEMRAQIIRTYSLGVQITIDIQDPEVQDHRPVLQGAIGWSVTHLASRIRVRFGQDPWVVVKDKAVGA